MTIADLLSTASDIGVVSLLLMIFYGGYKGFWEWGRTHREQLEDLHRQLSEQRTQYEGMLLKAEKDRDEWKTMAINATDIGKRITSVAEKSVQTT
jgi:hypothetical protein